VRKVVLKIILFVPILLLIGACAGDAEKDEEGNPQSVEIKEYLGTKLSSINDFRENSIKGPQYVDKDSFRLEITGLVNNPKTYTYYEIINRQGYKKL